MIKNKYDAQRALTSQIPMHILTVHCQYQQRGGEDCVYETESKLLRTAGNLVTELTLSNHEIDVNSLRDKVLVGARTIWSRKGKRALARTIGEASPDIVHFHNTFPLLSPSVYYACAEAGVPCVQTLHNYRLLCANAMLVRDGNVCELCLGGRFFSGVRYSCYRESRAASSAVVAMQYVHRLLGTFAKKVDRFIALTKFAREKFAADGIPLDKLVIKPNSLDMDPGEGSGDGGYALFVGRLSTEKGLATLMDAWRFLPNIPLKIVGDGPLFRSVTDSASLLGGDIEVLGPQDKRTVLSLMADARVLIVPSQCYEGFPMTIVESYACGTPVIASRIGSLAEVVEDGITGRHFTAGSAEELAVTVREVFFDRVTLARMRGEARRRFLTSFTPQKNVEALMLIYHKVIDEHRQRLR